MDNDALQDGQLDTGDCSFADADLLSKPVAISAGGSTELALDVTCLQTLSASSDCLLACVSEAQVSSSSWSADLLVCLAAAV